MKAQLLIPGAQFPAKIVRLMQTGVGIDLAIAFINERGLKLLYEAIERSLKRKAPVRFLVSLEMNISTPAALQRLKRLERYTGFELRCFARNGGIEMFHGKFLIIKNSPRPHVVIGSSNLTGGGYLNNAELNVLLEDSQIVADTQRYFDGLWNDVIDGGNSRLLTDDLLAEYRKRYGKIAHLKKRIKAKTITLGKFDDSSVHWDNLLSDARRFRRSAEYQKVVAERDSVVKRIRLQLDVPRFRHLTKDKWRQFFEEKALGHLIPIYRDNIFNHRGKLLKMFRLLTTETTSIEERWNQALSRYPVKYVGENIMSKVLTALDSVKYGVWNKASAHGMKRYGFFAGRNLTPGQRYKAMCQFQRKVCEKTGIKNNAILDHWLHNFYFED